MRKTTWCLTLLAAAALTTPGLNASAADAPVQEVVKADYKKAISDKEGYLTKEMIESCILLKKDIDERYAAISKVKAEFDALNKETTELGAFLKDNGEKIGKEGDKAARDDYEAKAKAYNDKIPVLNAQLDNYTKLSKEYEGKTARFDKECNGQAYYEDDYEEMKKKLGRGM